MASSSDERVRTIANNRSLRTIKTELENLFENGAIDEETMDLLIDRLPSESSSANRNAASNARTGSSNPPTTAMSNLGINNASSPPPPSYANTGPPSLPSRAPSAAPNHGEIARATALYRYGSNDPADCVFEVGDTISVLEHMNAEWDRGRNTRTGKEGMYPRNYVQEVPNYNEKANNGYGYPAPQQQYSGPPAPGPANPYNSDVPPMGVAEAPAGPPSKGSEMGKKFGKKLGNAAIFGAGATIGGNIVNSIF